MFRSKSAVSDVVEASRRHGRNI